jgi:hypothetical protein
MKRENKFGKTSETMEGMFCNTECGTLTSFFEYEMPYEKGN